MSGLKSNTRQAVLFAEIKFFPSRPTRGENYTEFIAYCSSEMNHGYIFAWSFKKMLGDQTLRLLQRYAVQIAAITVGINNSISIRQNGQLSPL